VAGELVKRPVVGGGVKPRAEEGPGEKHVSLAEEKPGRDMGSCLQSARAPMHR